MTKVTLKSQWSNTILNEFVTDLSKGIIEILFDMWNFRKLDMSFEEYVKIKHPDSVIIRLCDVKEVVFRIQ